MKKLLILFLMSIFFNPAQAVTLQQSFTVTASTPSTRIVNMLPRKTATGGNTICYLSKVEFTTRSGNGIDTTNRNQCAITAGPSVWVLQAVMGEFSTGPSVCNALCFSTN